MNIHFNQAHPGAGNQCYNHNHAAEASTAFDQVEKIQQCIRSLENEIKSQYGDNRKVFEKELESDESLLEQVQAGLVKLEVKKRANEALSSKIQEEVAKQVHAAVQAYQLEQVTANVEAIEL